MTFERTLALMMLSLAIGLFSLWGVRRKPAPGNPSWVPWHGLLFMALTLLILGAAHLPAVWPR